LDKHFPLTLRAAWGEKNVSEIGPSGDFRRDRNVDRKGARIAEARVRGKERGETRGRRPAQHEKKVVCFMRYSDGSSMVFDAMKGKEL